MITLNNIDLSGISLDSLPMQTIRLGESMGVFAPTIPTDSLIGIWSAKGKTNEDADRDILSDLSGNGNDFKCYNFLWGAMSGYGGYLYNFKSYAGTFPERWYTYEKTDHSIHVANAVANSAKMQPIVAFDVAPGQTINLKASLNIKSLGVSSSRVLLRHHDVNGGISVMKEYAEPGTFLIEINYTNTDASKYETFYLLFSWVGSYSGCNINFELSPAYPGALVFDGTSDFCRLPSMTFAKDFSAVFNIATYDYKLGGILGDPSIKYTVTPQNFSVSWDGVGFTWTHNTLIKSITGYGEVVYDDFEFFNRGNPLKSDFTSEYQIGKLGAQPSRIAFYSLALYNRRLSLDEIKTVYNYLIAI